MDSRAQRGGGGPTHHRWPQVCVKPDSLCFYKKQQTLIAYLKKPVPKGKEDFSPSNNPLIHTVSVPSGTKEHPVQYGLNFKEKLLQLPVLFPPDVNHAAAATW